MSEKQNKPIESQNEDQIFVDLMTTMYIDKPADLVIPPLIEKMRNEYAQLAKFAERLDSHMDGLFVVECFALAIEIIENKYGESFASKCGSSDTYDKLVEKYINGNTGELISTEYIPNMKYHHADIAKVAEEFGKKNTYNNTDNSQHDSSVAVEVFALVLEIHRFLSETDDDFEMAMRFATGKESPRG